MMNAVYNRLEQLFSKTPSCDWVRGRLVDYNMCRPNLSRREFRIIEHHLSDCPDCAQEFAEIEVAHNALAEILYSGESLPPIDAEAMARRIMERDVAACTSNPIQGIRRRHPLAFRALKPAGVFAGLAILLFTVPILAYVSHAINGYLSSSNDVQETAGSLQVTEQQMLVLETSPATDSVSSGNHNFPLCKAIDHDLDETLLTRIDEESALLAARAEVEAMLPHTEEEYEAWARKEYPHIMALYDILIGKGLSQEYPDQPKVPGNWADMTTAERFAALVPGSLSEDVREYLLEIATQAAHQGFPLWDGTLQNTPDWAQRLYAYTPQEQRPTHWRALLIYSGEIFKFDWPETLDEPNVIPTKIAPAQWMILLSEPSSTILPPDAPSEMPEGYLHLAAQNTSLLKSKLLYGIVSARVLEHKKFDELARKGEYAFVSLANTDETVCNGHISLKVLKSYFDSKWSILDILIH